MDQQTSNAAATAKAAPRQRIMNPQRQLPAHATHPFGYAAAAPLVMLGVATAGTVAYALSHRRQPTLAEQVQDDLTERAAKGRKAAAETLTQASEQTESLVKQAARTGYRLFRRGRATAEKAYDTTREEAEHLAKSARETGKEAAHTTKKATTKGLHLGRKAAANAADAVEHKYSERSPLLYGLLVAALVNYGEKLLERRSMQHVGAR
jgi:hypothetical protein